MRHALPRTPFSTPFSSSRKLLEARIRAILAGPQKRPPLPLLALTLVFCFFSVNLVSCQQQEPGPQIVMDVQYYDIYNNYIEIPRVVLPEGAEAGGELEAINQRLNALRTHYSFLSEGYAGYDPSPGSVSGFENRCLLYPAATDRYVSLIFFRDQFTTDLSSGHVLSLVYDLEQARQVTLADALALAELTEAELFAQLSQQLDPQIRAELPDFLKDADIGIQAPVLEGFRMAAGDRPVFYLTARVDDADDAVNDAVSGAEHLYIWDQGVFTRYDQYAMGEALQPLVPAEECLDLDPPLWRQWYFADGVPEGGLLTPASKTTVRDVLRGDARFYYQPEIPGEPEVRLTIHNAPALVDTANDSVTRITEFAAADLDGDGLPEAILRIGSADSNPEGYVILRQDGGDVCGYTTWFRSFLDLKTDGTYFFSVGGPSYGIVSRTVFTQSSLSTEPQAYSDFDGESITYFVGGEQATEEEYLTVYNAQAAKPDAQWYDFNDANIEALFS